MECAEILRGRSDKKFCSDYCRNTYNNRKYAVSNGNVRHVNGILRRNRRILKEIRESGLKRISERKLLDKGFRINYNTGCRVKPDGNVQFLIYDQVMEYCGGSAFVLDEIDIG